MIQEAGIQQNKKIKVGIIGHTGRLGRPLADILVKPLPALQISQDY